MFFFQFLFLLAGICFILSLRGLSSAYSSQKGNLLGIIGMGLAICTSLFFCSPNKLFYIFFAICIGAGIGLFIAQKIKMASLPQLIAAFHSLVGLAAVLVATVTLYSPQIFKLGMANNLKFINLMEIGIGTIIGAVTFTGSIIAFLKLQGIVKKKYISDNNKIIILSIISLLTLFMLLLFISTGNHFIFKILILLSLILGKILILPIGGADMPVVVSMLNSYSGWAAAVTGFTISNYLLIITGALVGASGAILSYIMCKNMNRSLISVIFGGGKNSADKSEKSQNEIPAKIGNAEDAAFILQNATNIIIIPGYGMAVAQAQHALSEIANILKVKGAKVRYAIHPVAGRMPGHMNVLLAEAKVPYDDVFELEDINGDFSATDVVFIIGANDITNPAAHNDPTSPIYGMPVLDVEKAGTVLFVKRSLGAGYAGIENELFYRDNTMMILGDGKKVCDGIVSALKREFLD
ncbi:MAG: NAD(P)(+) transhydrogenase (Re/Si-specific) subunit beta [Holosporales bacterium]|nr:NAD(P)(+) transhydrogenase (Re/Si-specific) subunit beta [Holosporales bacterium]